jgi:hypothetical protein
MPTEENNPLEKAPKKETRRPNVLPEDEAPEKTETKSKKKKTASKRKKSEGKEVLPIRKTSTGYIFDARKKPEETEDVQTGSQAEDSTPSSHNNEAPDPARVVAAQPAVPLRGDGLVDEAVQFINETANKSVYLGYFAIGAYVLKYFYGDNIALATSRNPKKPLSYTALCKREDLVVKPESLSVMLRVAAQEKFFAISDVNVTALSYSHKAELVKLDNDKSKINLVKKAVSGSLSVRELSELVDKAREKPSPEPRLLGGDLDRFMFSPEKLFDDPSRTALLRDDQIRKEHLKNLKAKTRRKLLGKVSQAVEKAEEWVELYEDLKRDLEEIESEEKPIPPDK